MFWAKSFPLKAGEARLKQVHPGKRSILLLRFRDPAVAGEAVQDLEEEGGSDGPPSSRGKEERLGEKRKR